MESSAGDSAKKHINIYIVSKARPSDYLCVLMAAAIWGGSFPSTKIALAQADPIMILWLRFLIAAPMLMCGAYFQKCLRPPTKKEFLPLFLMGFQGIFFHQGIQAYAMRTSGAGNANWLMVASPAVVAILGRIFLKERISRYGLAGLALSAVGVMLVLAFGTVRNTAFTGFGSVGDMILIASVLNWAVFSIISRKFLLSNVPSSFAIMWEMIFSLFYATLFLIFTRADFSIITTFNAVTWRAVIFLGVFASATAYMFWFRGLSKISAARVVVFQFVQPVVGIILSYFLVGERFTIWLFIGGALIASGVYLVNKVAASSIEAAAAPLTTAAKAKRAD